MRPLLQSFFRQPSARRPRPCLLSSFQRSIVTSHVDPPLDSNIPERPWLIALVQDPHTYKDDNRWEEELRRFVPRKFGMPFACLKVPFASPELGDCEDDDEEPSLLGDAEEEEFLLDTLTSDLASLRNPLVVLIARGPRVSWLAQLHLESNSLAGLVLVDPDNEAPFTRRLSLKVEPNSVPMMIFHSSKDHKPGAQRAAKRHGTKKKKVPLVGLDNNKGYLELTFRESIAPWIERQVL